MNKYDEAMKQLDEKSGHKDGLISLSTIALGAGGAFEMDYLSVKQAAEKWGVSEPRVHKLCETNRIPGAERFGYVWAIPKDAEKPADRRKKEKKA